MLEKTLESSLDCKEIKPVNPKGNQSWIFIGRTDAEAEAPVLWLPDVKSCLIRKDPDAGEDRGQEAKRTTEDKMVGWHHQLNGHEFEQALGDGEGQGSLECCSPWGRKKSDTTEWLNNNKSETASEVLCRLYYKIQNGSPTKFCGILCLCKNFFNVYVKLLNSMKLVSSKAWYYSSLQLSWLSKDHRFILRNGPIRSSWERRHFPYKFPRIELLLSLSVYSVSPSFFLELLFIEEVNCRRGWEAWSYQFIN